MHALDWNTFHTRACDYVRRGQQRPPLLLLWLGSAVVTTSPVFVYLSAVLEEEEDLSAARQCVCHIMVKLCVCAGCTNSCLTGHRVHLFPKKGSPAFRSWVRFVQVKRPDFTASSVQDNSVICGAHFRDEDYIPGELMAHKMGFRSRVRLIKGAVPSIQSPGQTSTTTGRSSTAVNKLGLSRVSFTTSRCVSMRYVSMRYVSMC